jgi:hypothetical protein
MKGMDVMISFTSFLEPQRLVLKLCSAEKLLLPWAHRCLRVLASSQARLLDEWVVSVYFLLRVRWRAFYVMYLELDTIAHDARGRIDKQGFINITQSGEAT